MRTTRRFPVASTAAAATALAMLVARAAGASPNAHETVVPLLLGISVILGVAKVFGWLATRIGQPAVLGELLAGILLGNLALVGIHGLEWLRDDPTLAILAELGVIVLLFEVGLESTVEQMRRIGASALLVALVGVIAPFLLGWLAGAWLLPGQSPYVHVFLGAVLTATSVGITARVLRDLNATRSIEARIILGAAVIDDVLGLVILAVVSGVIAAANGAAGGVSLGSVAWIATKSLGFLAAAILLGMLFARPLLRLAARIRVQGILLTSGLIFCFLLAYLSALADLAPIVGAYAAGLILEGSYFERFEESRDRNLESLLHPISTLLVPIFFVLTGMRVELLSLGDPRILALAAVLTIAAWAGKQLCSIAVLGRGIDRMTIGLGMVPRGEVGLIFASIGATLTVAGERVITPATYSAVVIMVIVTTLVTPPALKWSLSRKQRRRHPKA
jgi:Kef-type K+ transport system membrane component KefB